MSETFTLHCGDAPLLISVPHAGTGVPPDIQCCLSEAARPLPDTDWHVDRLYDFAADLGASVLVARLSRYVVDLNRSPNDQSLYPGQVTTGLVPIDTFQGKPVYNNDIDPDLSEIAGRVDAYWQPYHDALSGELDRLTSAHGHAVLWDAHSIASAMPRLFEGRLPDFNFGTNEGMSCAPALAEAVVARARKASSYSSVLNGRFRGGFITRNYGLPEFGVHAIQLELSQATYLDESPPWHFRPDLAEGVRPHLSAFLEICRNWRP